MSLQETEGSVAISLFRLLRCSAPCNDNVKKR